MSPSTSPAACGSAPTWNGSSREVYEVDPRRAESFYASIRRYWPGLPDGSLVPDYAGIRPKLTGPGETGGRFRDRGSGGARAAGAGASLRHREPGPDLVPLPRRGGGRAPQPVKNSSVIRMNSGTRTHARPDHVAEEARHRDAALAGDGVDHEVRGVADIGVGAHEHRAGRDGRERQGAGRPSAPARRRRRARRTPDRSARCRGTTTGRP